MSSINSLICDKHFSPSNISTVEYMSCISTVLIGNFSSRKRLGKPLAITNQKKIRIENSISDTVNSKTPQFLVHMSVDISTHRRSAYCDTKEKERMYYVLFVVFALV